ncbi:MAG: hypothetical protein RLZZ113_1562, partial [Pseudomonadota bacterium]
MTAALRIRRLSSAEPNFQKVLAELLRFDPAQDEAIVKTVKEIIANVRLRGDDALLKYTAEFDQVHLSAASGLEISKAQLQQALD